MKPKIEKREFPGSLVGKLWRGRDEARGLAEGLRDEYEPWEALPWETKANADALRADHDNQVAKDLERD